MSICLYSKHTGVLWIDNKAIEGSNLVLNRLQALGKRIFFVTNNATKSRDTYVELARNRGFDITKDQIITPILSTVNYLRSLNFDKKVYSIGQSVVDELKELNIRCTDPDTDIINKHYSTYDLKALKLGTYSICIHICETYTCIRSFVEYI